MISLPFSWPTSFFHPLFCPCLFEERDWAISWVSIRLLARAKNTPEKPTSVLSTQAKIKGTEFHQSERLQRNQQCYSPKKDTNQRTGSSDEPPADTMENIAIKNNFVVIAWYKGTSFLNWKTDPKLICLNIMLLTKESQQVILIYGVTLFPCTSFLLLLGCFQFLSLPLVFFSNEIVAFFFLKMYNLIFETFSNRTP